MTSLMVTVVCVVLGQSPMADYLPLRVGTVMTYEIELGQTDPISYREIVWPAGNGESPSSGRRMLSLDIQAERKRTKKAFVLKLRIKDGFELAVEKDELGIYENAKQIFWATSGKDPFICRQVVTYKLDGIINPDNATGDGHSDRTFLFEGKPGDQRMEVGDSHDNLVFKGIDPVPELYISGLHFLRIVKRGYQGEDDSSYKKDGTLPIHEGFEEHSYFVKGRGLVFLEQKVGGKTSMTWKLVSLTQ